MGIHIGIITVMGDDFHPTRRLKEAAKARGHRITVIHPYQKWPGLKGGLAHLVPSLPATPFTVVLPRQGAMVGESCLSLVRQFDLMGIPLINGFVAITLSRNQFFTLQALSAANISVPDTMFVNSHTGFKTAIDRLGGLPLVAKATIGLQGEGVFLLTTPKQAQEFEKGNLDKKKGLILQKFFPPQGRRDFRILIVGAKMAGAVQLSPVKGDFRANYSLAGKLWPVNPPQHVIKMALAATRAMGLEIAGVDLIADQEDNFKIIEINYSPGFKGMEAATGLNIAGAIVDYIEKTYDNQAV